MKLTSQAVHDIMIKVLFQDEEMPKDGSLPSNTIKVEGLIRDFGFNAERVMAAKPDIDALLLQLPPTFQKDQGGGWSFLNGCIDKNEEQWGEQDKVEELVCLGIAVGSASWIMKEFAPIMPGGVPYFETHVKQANPVEAQ